MHSSHIILSSALPVHGFIDGGEERGMQKDRWDRCWTCRSQVLHA